jgi:hypothetical protein
MVENTHQKYEKNQNKTSVAKRFTGPFLALRAPDRCSYWNPSRRHWLWRGQLFMRTKKWDASGRRKIAFAFDNVKQVNEELE